MALNLLKTKSHNVSLNTYNILNFYMMKSYIVLLRTYLGIFYNTKTRLHTSFKQSKNVVDERAKLHVLVWPYHHHVLPQDINLSYHNFHLLKVYSTLLSDLLSDH